MGSVIDYIECPKCKQEAYSDFYYKTGEEYVHCSSCGYYYSATIKNRNKKLNELEEEDWEILEAKNPYGAFKIKYSEEKAEEWGTKLWYRTGTLATESEYAELLQHLSNNDDVEFCSISRLVDGEIINEVIIDNGPETDSAGFTKEDR